MIAPLRDFDLTPTGQVWDPVMVLPLVGHGSRTPAAPLPLTVTASAREQAFDYSDVESFSNRVADYLTREKLWPRPARA